MNKAKVIEYFGTRTRVASFLGISPASVTGWSDIIPEKQALRLERMTKGKLRYDPACYERSQDK